MLTGLTVFLIPLLTLLALPVTVLYQFNVQQAVEGQIKLQWLAGLVKFSLPVFASRKRAAKRPPTKMRKRTVSVRFSRFMLTGERKLLWQRVVKFIRDLWRAIKKREMHLTIRIGLGDPADTGRIWAFLGPVSQVLVDIKDATIEIEPVFDDAVFQLQSRGIIRIIPLQFLFLVIGLILSPSVWKGLKHINKGN